MNDQTTQPDTDAPPWCTCQRRDALGPYVPCHLHDVPSDSPQEGRPTTPQTEAPLLWLMRQMLNRGIADESNRDTLAAIFDEAKARYPEAAAGALPSVDGALLAQYWFEDWSGERFSNLEDQRLWLERGSRVAARLAAAPPEASE
jgi:hypothetical protein